MTTMSVQDERVSTPAEQLVAPDEFKSIFRHYPGGVTVITADPGTGPVALTATSMSSVSAAPPLIVFSVSEFSSSTPAILASDTVVVHMLGARHLPLARLCATSGVDRFADARSWERLPTGEPRFLDVSAWLRCHVVDRLRAGGSTVVLAEVVETGDLEPVHDVSVPLTYHNRTWHRLDNASRIEDSA